MNRVPTLRRSLAACLARAALLILVFAGGASLAQGFSQLLSNDTLLTVTPASLFVGQTATAHVIPHRGFDFPPELDWGDGSPTESVPLHSDATYDHVYAAAGSYTVSVLEESYEDTNVDVLVSPAPSLSLDPTLVAVARPVTATMSGTSPNGAPSVLVDWGDGTVESAADGSMAHTYAAEGAFVVLLRTLDGVIPGTQEAVTVNDALGSTSLRLDPPTVSVGEDVTATITNVGGSATLAWGDGSTVPVNDDGDYVHAYRVTGAFTVLLRGPGGTVIGADAVTVVSSGNLEADPPTAAVGEPLTLTAAGLAPGLAYRVDLGDGQRVAFSAPPNGVERIEHVYTTPDPTTRASLWLVEGGAETRLALLPLPVLLPVATETIDAEQTDADPVAGVIDVAVTLGGLLVGQSYQLASPYGQPVDIVADSQVEHLTMHMAWEGEAALELSLVSRGFATPRAFGSVDLRWPRADVALAVTSPTPALVGEPVTFTATGLTPGLEYSFLSDREGFVQERFVAGNDSQSFDVSFNDAPGPRTARLSVFYPNGGMPTEEEVASTTVDRLEPTGAIGFEGRTIRYGFDSTVTLSDLVPGRRYRLALNTDTSVSVMAPTDGTSVLPYPFAERRGALRLYAELTRDEVFVAEADPPGVTFTGKVAFSYEDFYPDYRVSVHLTDLVPSHDYRLDLGDGETAAVTADEDGNANLDHVFAGTTHGRQEWQLVLHIEGFGDPAPVVTYATLGAYTMPPVSLAFGGNVVVRVLGLDQTFVYPGSNSDLAGTAVLDDLVLGGRLQYPITFRFQDLSVSVFGALRIVKSGTADSAAESQELALPARLNGLNVHLDTFQLRADQAPVMEGGGSLTDGRPFSLRGPIAFNETPSDGMLFTVAPDAGPLPIGDSGWEFTNSNGTDAHAVLDLSTATNYNLIRGDRDALEDAYRGWTLLERAPAVSPTNASWTGLVFASADVHRQGVRTVGYESAYTTTVAWTGTGYSTFIQANLPTDANGMLRVGGWDLHVETPYSVAVVDSQVVRSSPAAATVHLPFFGTDTPVAITPKGGRGAGYDVRTAVPVTVDFGQTAVVAGVGVFLDSGLDNAPLPLVFPSALWSLDGDLATDPNTLDTSAADQLLASFDDPTGATDEVKTSFADAKATAETALNLYKLQFLLNDLTLQPNGDVSLGGDEWRTLAKAPTLDMYGFPYLAAGAEIGVKRATGTYEGEYALGLQGSITIGDVLGAEAAPSWFYVKDGRAQRWEFEGFSLTFGGLESVPVSFSLIAGGTIDLIGNDLEFHGGGSLTLEGEFNVQVAGVFGQYEGTTYWFVYAGSDLALAEKPIEIKVEGVPVLSFYVFRGGIGSHLDLTTYGGANDDCRVDDADIPNGTLPSVVVHARQCLAPDNPVSFLAGTLIGSPSEVADGYGFLWHLDGNLVINTASNLELSGRGWTMKTLDDGYRANAAPNLAGRFAIDANAITATLCAGPGNAPVAGLDCSSLEPFRIAPGGLTLVEVKGLAQFHASWTDSEYFFALGTQSNPLYLYTFPNYKTGYLVFGQIERPGLIDANIGLPVNGIFAAGSFGWSASYEKSGSLLFCDWSVHADADFGFGGGFRIYAAPGGSASFAAQVNVGGGASAGASGCDIGGDLSVSMRAEGRLSGPSPFRFDGTINIKVSVPVIDDIDVSLHRTIDIPVPGA